MTTTTKKPRAAKKADKSKQAILKFSLDAKTKDEVTKFFKKRGLSNSDGMRILIDQALEDNQLSHTPNAQLEKDLEDGFAEKRKTVTRGDIWNMWNDE